VSAGSEISTRTGARSCARPRRANCRNSPCGRAQGRRRRPNSRAGRRRGTSQCRDDGLRPRARHPARQGCPGEAARRGAEQLVRAVMTVETSGVPRSDRTTRRSRPEVVRPPAAKKIRRRPTLPGGCPPSTIGAGGLNCSVRNGKRCTPAAMTTGNCEVLASSARGEASACQGHCAPSKLHSDNTVFKIKTSGN
jgi:hypothetical protein